ncbi:MAG: tetratricopeptide repeat protein [Pseudomonadota bacterium]
MALNQFVKKASENKSAPGGTTQEITGAATRSRPIGLDYTQRAAIGNSEQTESETPLPEHTPAKLSESECETLMSLAAVQIRYNRCAEAVPYLMMLRKMNPQDTKAARLLALALIKLGNWAQAETILSQIHDHPASADPAVSGMLSFYRSVVAFKQRKLDAAREWLNRFRTFLAGAA